MNFGYALAISIVFVLILERILLYAYVYRRKKKLSFKSYFLVAFYKPLLIALALTIYSYYRAQHELTVWIMAGLTVLTPLVFYPIAKFFYSRAGSTPPSKP